MTDTRPGKAAAPAAAEDAKETSEKDGSFVLTLPLGLTIVGLVGVLVMGLFFAGYDELAGPAILFGWLFGIALVICALGFYNDQPGNRWAMTVAGFWLTTIAIGTLQLVAMIGFGVDLFAWAD